VASRFRESGGPYLYARAAFGAFAGFEVGWLLWLSRVTGFAALCNLFVGYLSYFVPVAAAGWWRSLVIVTVVSLLTAINYAGVRATTRLNNFFTVGKLLPLVLFVGVGLFFVDPQRYRIVAPPSYHGFTQAALLLVFAYTAFEVAIIAAGETRDPQHDVPFALLAAIAIVVVLYVSIQAVCIGTFPELATSERPLADAAFRFMGGAGATIISLGALL
jgi:amino acid transporter